MNQLEFLHSLEETIAQRLTEQPEDSYTAQLANQGLRKVAQKVGEEGVEVALAAVDESSARLVSETADLLYHLLILLQLRDSNLDEVVAELKRRH